MQRKRARSAQSGNSNPTIQVVGSVRREVFLVVRVIEPSPFLLLFIPPDQLLALAPRPSIRTRRRAVINDAAIVRPRKSPAMPQQVFRLAFIRAIAAFLGIHSAINPRPAGGRPVVLQFLNVFQLLSSCAGACPERSGRVVALTVFCVPP